MTIIAQIKPARRVLSDKPTVEFVVFRLIQCEAALREAIEFAEMYHKRAIDDAERLLIKDHIDYLASIECPEEFRQ